VDLTKIVDKDEALRVLAGFNPWWAGRPFREEPFRRLAFNACKKYLQDHQLKRALLLSGPRRVGKTTILYQLAREALESGLAPPGEVPDPKSILYLSLDHPLLKLLGLDGALRLYHEAIWPEGRPALLLLDEVQYSRNWGTDIKLLVDLHPEYRIVATGSASVAHRDQLAESGVGRWLTISVPTLSFYEFVHIRQEPELSVPSNLRPTDLFGMSTADRVALAERLRPLLPSFQRYLLVGGFPETARQADITLCQRLLREDVVERVLKRDMTALFGVRNVDVLEKIFIYLCLHSGGIVAHKTVADALGVSALTVANHLDLLEQANLVYKLPPFDVGGKKVLKARNKYYLADAALRNAVLLRGEEVLTSSDEMGTIVETTVLRHLYAYYYRDTPTISYWRDIKTDKEVDIIVKSPQYILPAEVKYRESAELEKSSGLVELCRTEPVKWAYLVTKREHDFGPQEVDGVTARFMRVPAHVLCYLLGQAERLLWL
jgi:predicted AAA+ superfamily ATPase